MATTKMAEKIEIEKDRKKMCGFFYLKTLL